MTLSNRERILLVVCLGAIILGAFVWFLYLPNSREIAALEELNHSLRGEIEQLQAVPALTDPGLVSVETAVEQMEASFPLQPDQVAVMDIINQAARGHDLLLLSVSNTGASKGADERTGKLVFNIRTKGGFHDSMDFLKKLQDGDRVSSAANIVLNGVKKSAGSAGAAATVSEAGPEQGFASAPVYFLQPLAVPVAKSVSAQPETPARETAVSSGSDKRQAQDLVPGQVEMQLDLSFYYYNEETAGAGKSATQKNTAE